MDQQEISPFDTLFRKLAEDFSRRREIRISDKIFDKIDSQKPCYGLSYWITKDPEIKKMKTKPNEGDINSTKKGTCARSNSGKVKFSLLPMQLLHGVVRVLEFGRRKYAEWNWTKGGKWSSPFDCMMRHLIKWWYYGEEDDEESGLGHLEHALCNILFLIHYRDTYMEGDDRPPQDLTSFDFTLESFSEKLFFDEEQMPSKTKPITPELESFPGNPAASIDLKLEEPEASEAVSRIIRLLTEKRIQAFQRYLHTLESLIETTANES